MAEKQIGRIVINDQGEVAIDFAKPDGMTHDEWVQTVEYAVQALENIRQFVKEDYKARPKLW
jgi:hypothetical protein